MFIFPSFEAGKFKINMLLECMSGEVLLPGSYTAVFSLELTRQKGWEALYYRLIPHDLIFSWRSLLPNTITMFNIRILGSTNI